MLSVIIGVACLVWYGVVAFICVLGCTQIFLNYRERPSHSLSERLPVKDVPHVSVIRPIKGLEPDLYECLTSTLQQTYPIDKLSTFFCISSRDDPALPILERLLRDYPHHDVCIFVEDEDRALQSGQLGDFGPNPKIRNMSRAYRQAKGDIVWIVDCNVWVGKGVCGRLVDLLCGIAPGSKPFKFVHQLPLVVDITQSHKTASQGSLLPSASVSLSRSPDQDQSSSHYERLSTNQTDHSSSTSVSHLFSTFGGRLDELFLSSAHAKFYTAINTVAIAPCIVGKSNMFRRSHLGALTADRGIDHFSHNICEDHLIGDLLWKKAQPFEGDIDYGSHAPKFGKHAMLFGDLAIQPTAHMSVVEYVARRIRWLRVRKFTVALATFVEPGTESLLCSAYGAWGFSSVPFFRDNLGIPQTWVAFFCLWLLSISIWCICDWGLFCMLQSLASIEVDTDTPAWAQGPRTRSFGSWCVAWLGRELLALPVWTWAVWGGMTVVWRGRRFKVGLDMKVRALDVPTVQSPNRALRGTAISTGSSRSPTPVMSGKKRQE